MNLGPSSALKHPHLNLRPSRPSALSHLGCALVWGCGLVAPIYGAEAEIRPFLDLYCLECHGGDKVKGKVDFSGIRTEGDVDSHFDLWEVVADVLKAGDMPPEDETQPSAAERQQVLDWYQTRFLAVAEARPGTFKPRRLSGPEYRNTLRSLLGFDLEVAIAEAEETVLEKSLVLKLLPTDPPGESGFVNDTHGARLSTNLWDQYSYLADVALEELFAPHRREARGKLMGLTLAPDFENADFDPGQATALVRQFVRKAMRRPVPEARMNAILSQIDGKSGVALVKSTQSELKTVLMSPAFLYRGLLMPKGAEARRAVDDFELAERLSYFLWEDMPDAELMKITESGTLTDPEVLKAQVDRMLLAPAARTLSESFGVQWLTLDTIDDPGKRAHITSALRSQPNDFIQYLFTEARPIMELIDSKVAFANHHTAQYYGADSKQMKKFVGTKGIERQAVPNQRIHLEKAEGRGGLLTMPGVLTMNKGPILRGTWMLRAILGEHLGEPPADVPPIKPSPPGQKLTFRQRFEMHRSDPTCARCHEKIDPLGFSLQAYDETGGFMLAANYKPAKNQRSGDNPREIDTSGKLPSGETFGDFAELKTILLTRKREDIIRNVVERLLSYALCRKLERFDQPTVTEITRKLHETDGTWRDLVQEIVGSVPFRETLISTHEAP